MAQRPVFIPCERAPYVSAHSPEFTWNGGFAVSQKQKNITALHNAFRRSFPDSKILEISSKSMQELGVRLSAFNLMKFIPSLGKSIPVECAFQGGKVFSDGGPYTDLYHLSPRDAKRDPRTRQGSTLCSFSFEGESIPLKPKTAFYNWLYINALFENPEYAELIMQYDAFTDIEFNPNKSINCQAEAAAVFVSLFRKGALDQCSSFKGFIQLFNK